MPTYKITLVDNFENKEKGYKKTLCSTIGFTTAKRLTKDNVIEVLNEERTVESYWPSYDYTGVSNVTIMSESLTYSEFLNVYSQLWADAGENYDAIQEIEAEYPEFTQRYDDMCENAEALCITNTVYTR